MKTVEDPTTRKIANVRNRRICHRGLSSAGRKPSAAATEVRCDTTSNIVESKLAMSWGSKAEEVNHAF
jgi:hypothetical protein